MADFVANSLGSFDAGQIAQRIQEIREVLPVSVQLIAVTKQVSVAAMRAAYAAGVRHFGESRIQEAITKQEQLTDLADVTWHLIGHLQSNKAGKALEIFQWIHSVDSLKLAQRLDSLAAQHQLRPHVCLQVKMLPDPTKFGWDEAQLLADLAALDECQHLDITGLMVIPPFGLPDEATLDVFKRTHQLAQTIQQRSLKSIRMEELSMGMSNDYRLAVQAGATFVRLGRTLFGDRAG
ncbi:YggS family pyridoxal phosphate-dependent enzyme [Leptolyngbya sp. AN02str]|uniref:YggS family pyridoxal phosphate-dependent enzyme n=1 Tax=Leptolyngbya sp. AN02str TaxID=3423363 RepID=UPI003D311FFA